MKRRTFRAGDRTLTEFFDGAHRSDHSTRFVATQLQSVVRPGDVVAETGCGTGVLAMTAAALGAARVWAVDVDAAAVALCSASARANGLPAVRAVTGVLLDPLPADSPLDLVVAVMPQKPSNSAFSARYAGGADGADLVCAAIDAAAARLSSGGRLLVYHHSVAHPARVEAALARSFEWSTAASRLRCFGAQRYERQAPGMLAHLSALAEAGTVDVRIGAAHLVWRSRVIAAVRR